MRETELLSRLRTNVIINHYYALINQGPRILQDDEATRLSPLSTNEVPLPFSDPVASLTAYSDRRPNLVDRFAG